MVRFLCLETELNLNRIMPIAKPTYRRICSHIETNPKTKTKDASHLTWPHQLLLELVRPLLSLDMAPSPLLFVDTVAIADSHHRYNFSSTMIFIGHEKNTLLSGKYAQHFSCYWPILLHVALAPMLTSQTNPPSPGIQESIHILQLLRNLLLISLESFDTPYFLWKIIIENK